MALKFPSKNIITLMVGGSFGTGFCCEALDNSNETTQLESQSSVNPKKLVTEIVVPNPLSNESIQNNEIPGANNSRVSVLTEVEGVSLENNDVNVESEETESTDDEVESTALDDEDSETTPEDGKELEEASEEKGEDEEDDTEGEETLEEETEEGSVEEPSSEEEQSLSQEEETQSTTESEETVSKPEDLVPDDKAPKDTQSQSETAELSTPQTEASIVTLAPKLEPITSTSETQAYSSPKSETVISSVISNPAPESRSVGGGLTGKKLRRKSKDKGRDTKSWEQGYRIGRFKIPSPRSVPSSSIS